MSLSILIEAAEYVEHCGRIVRNCFNQESRNERLIHKEAEKLRRAHLKDHFENLQQVLPIRNTSQHVSTLETLQQAKMFIRVLKNKNLMFRKEIEKLTHDKANRQLKLASMRKELLASNISDRKPSNNCTRRLRTRKVKEFPAKKESSDWKALPTDNKNWIAIPPQASQYITLKSPPGNSSINRLANDLTIQRKRKFKTQCNDFPTANESEYPLNLSKNRNEKEKNTTSSPVAVPNQSPTFSIYPVLQPGLAHVLTPSAGYHTLLTPIPFAAVPSGQRIGHIISAAESEPLIVPQYFLQPTMIVISHGIAGVTPKMRQ